MPGKSTFPERHSTSSRAPVFPADADGMLDLHHHPHKPATSSPPDSSVTQEGRSLKYPSRLQVRAGYGRSDRESITGRPAASFLTVELLRIEKTLENHTADARQRDDLPQCWRRT